MMRYSNNNCYSILAPFHSAKHLVIYLAICIYLSLTWKKSVLRRFPDSKPLFIPIHFEFPAIWSLLPKYRWYGSPVSDSLPTFLHPWWSPQLDHQEDLQTTHPENCSKKLVVTVYETSSRCGSLERWSSGASGLRRFLCKPFTTAILVRPPWDERLVMVT